MRSWRVNLKYMFSIEKIVKEPQDRFNIINNAIKVEQGLISALHILESLLENSSLDDYWQKRIFSELSKYNYLPDIIVKADIGEIEPVYINAKIIKYEDAGVRVREENSDDEWVLPLTAIRFGSHAA